MLCVLPIEYIFTYISVLFISEQVAIICLRSWLFIVSLQYTPARLDRRELPPERAAIVVWYENTGLDRVYRKKE
jgi:hypothetical protein